MKHVMVDIETLADTNNAVIVSIGAVKFDIISGETGDTFYETVDIDSCLKAGFEVTGGTIKWWMKQSDGARREFGKEGIHIALALQKLATFLQDDDYAMWSNGLRFDIAILENAYRRLELVVPWNHRKEMDVRTLVQFAPEIKSVVCNTWNDISHHALNDCKKQIKYCSQTYNKIIKH